MKKKQQLVRILALASFCALNACAPSSLAPHLFASKPHEAAAVLRPTKGYAAKGVLIFTQRPGKDLLIRGAFAGLSPGAHGLHIHAVGDCSAPDAASAGPIFNPYRMRHGEPGGRSSKLGDLPMLTAGNDGKARFMASMGKLTLENGKGSILGRSVVVTARPDDFTTQPDGRSGAPIACGVIFPR